MITKLKKKRKENDLLITMIYLLAHIFIDLLILMYAVFKYIDIYDYQFLLSVIFILDSKVSYYILEELELYQKATDNLSML